MAYNSAPSSFFGAAYALASSAISFQTVTETTGVTVGTTFVGAASTDTLTTATAHGLLVGDRVRVVAGTGALPTGLSAATDYWVHSVASTLTLKLAATRGGVAIDITADGGTGHILKSMGQLYEVTDTEANATTGDWRKVLFGLMEMIYYKWTGTATADRPGKVSVTRSASVNNATNEITRRYTVSITLNPGTVDVSAE
jgi:hypothetical protein